MRFLTILEVSQKQAYIFASNKLKDNILNSAVIAYVLGADYLFESLSGYGYNEGENLVYSGGGHTILEFASQERAVECTAALTEKVYREFDGLQIFARTIPYIENMSPRENLKNLTKELEKKKSVRLSAFHKGSFGIEKYDSTTLAPLCVNEESETKKQLRIHENAMEQAFYPSDFRAAYAFGDLGGAKGTSNFIAVVHIDGNGMGKRVEQLYDDMGDTDWRETKKRLRSFSEGIDADFKDAFFDMAKEVGTSSVLNELELREADSSGRKYFPIRRVITAGDDICFVTEGRIGLECARIFLEKLAEHTNCEDKKEYSACAGVAIVHQKYPFYKAYELAEMLCSNAKKFGASISPEDNGCSISAIDWHIEFGELKDTLEEVRQDYLTIDDKCVLNLRPYIVHAPDKMMTNKDFSARQYTSFKRLISNLMRRENEFGIGKLKELRGALKSGQQTASHYIKFNRMNSLLIEAQSHGNELDLSTIFTGTNKEGDIFITLQDGTRHCILFDAIEMLDTFLPIEERGLIIDHKNVFGIRHDFRKRDERPGCGGYLSSA